MTDLTLINANIVPMTNENLMIEQMYIVIRNGIIASVGSMRELGFSSDEPVVDLCGRYALPGFIELHAHVIEEPRTNLALNKSDSHLVMGARAARNLQKALQAGITTICDCGAPCDLTLQLRSAVENGIIEGPRLFVCGPLLTAPGGHGAELGWEVSGHALPRAIRELAALGVDFVKVINDPISYTLSELTGAVREAHRLGMHIACHAYTEGAIWLALQAGCDCIEHAVACSVEMLSFMQRHRVAIVPTYTCAQKSCTDLNESLLSQEDAERYFFPWLELLQQNLPICLSTPELLIGAGTDAGFPPIDFDSLIEEIWAFVEMGASPFRSLSAVTRSASEIRGLTDRVGTIEPGKTADIVVVNQNPLENIHSISDVRAVIQGGKLVKNRL